MHTKLVSLFIALFLCLPLFAQKESVPRIDSEGVYLIPDEMPKFPGGMQAMMKYLATNVKYPVEAQKKGVSGRVIIQFVVMEDGTPGQGKVVRGVDPLLDEEALRVVKTMPKWSPGMADGKAVKVRFTIPVMFSLSKKQNGNTPNMNIPELTVPSGQEVTNKSLEAVILQSPAAGTALEAGDCITLTVARAVPDPFRQVPSLLGMSVAEARRRLAIVELLPTLTPSNLTEGTITAQDPLPGTLLHRNAHVRLVAK